MGATGTYEYRSFYFYFYFYFFHSLPVRHNYSKPIYRLPRTILRIFILIKDPDVIELKDDNHESTKQKQVMNSI